MINTLPGNNRTGYCYDKLKRFRQWDTSNLHIQFLFYFISQTMPHALSFSACSMHHAAKTSHLHIHINSPPLHSVNTAVSLQSENHLLQCENIAPSVPLH